MSIFNNIINVIKPVSVTQVAKPPFDFSEREVEEEPEHETDAWEADEYGYADADFLGTEEWEDQEGMNELKAYLRLDPNWLLVKCVNFDARKLREMDEWLKENCPTPYERVGWNSGCSTKIGVAFENGTDAMMFKLRWR